MGWSQSKPVDERSGNNGSSGNGIELSAPYVSEGSVSTQQLPNQTGSGKSKAKKNKAKKAKKAKGKGKK